jgi:isoleucyl-tRNA synthetase
MSKSIGNVIAPKKVIDRYGAEILRLWVAASDYRDDIRISENILTQLSDAYRRIRNTCRFMLGNLFDFNPDQDSVDVSQMTDIDQFAMHTLQELITRNLSAYENFDFHVVYHSLYNYCTVTLSAFYLDILKDRLYTSNPESLQRRSAQTAMHHIVSAIARLMAPILPFTAEEIWRFMPAAASKSSSIHLEEFPALTPAFVNSPLAGNWERILDVRGEVTKVLESARVEKTIGHSLDAAVFLSTSGDLYDLLASYEMDLRSIFIVSEAHLVSASAGDEGYVKTEIPGLSIRVGAAAGEKCQRCWVYDRSVGTHPEHVGICGRCRSVLESMASV